MLGLLLFLLLLAAVTVFPVMIAAKLVGAKNTDFAHALLALFLQGVLSWVLHAIFLRPLLAGLISLLVGPAIYAAVLKTTYLRGLAISFLFVLIVMIFLMLLGPMMGFHYMNMHWMQGDVV
ncbi:MAG TPA: hypothetical protein VG962_10095 [Steroidobacteraceae bacterium]|nr:hypothetical protein [Steroidobacteraceae bacterium]